MSDNLDLAPMGATPVARGSTAGVIYPGGVVHELAEAAGVSPIRDHNVVKKWKVSRRIGRQVAGKNSILMTLEIRPSPKEEELISKQMGPRVD